MQAKLPLPIFFLALAISAPLLLHQGPQPQARRLGRALPPWQGLAHVVATVWATLHARYAIYDALHMGLGARPAEGTLVGALLLVAAGGCTPLLTRHYPQWREGRRWLGLAAVAGLLLTVLRPPLPLQACSCCMAGIGAAYTLGLRISVITTCPLCYSGCTFKPTAYLQHRLRHVGCSLE